MFRQLVLARIIEPASKQDSLRVLEEAGVARGVVSIVFAALAVTRFIEARTGWSIKRFVRTARCYRTIQIRAGHHLLTAEDPLPPDLRDVLTRIK